MKSYTFNTRSVFLLAKLLKHFESNIEEFSQLIDSSGELTPENFFSKISSEKFLTLLFRVIGSASEAEETAIKILAVGIRKSETEIQAMDGVEFISEMREYLSSLDWTTLLGELLGSVVAQTNEPEAPPKVQKKPQRQTSI